MNNVFTFLSIGEKLPSLLFFFFFLVILYIEIYSNQIRFIDQIAH